MPTPSPRHSGLEALRTAIRDRQVVVVVGSGVSIQATGNAPAASWKGLIRLGIEACPRWDSKLDRAWVKKKLDDLDSGDRIGLIGLADEVRRRIGTTDGRLGQWLNETIRPLQAKHRAILDALHGLDCPIVTTNYDALLDRNDLKPVTWQQAAHVDRIIRGEDKGIIHLHGRFDEPASVVLGIEDYVAVRDGAFAKAVREGLAMTRTLLFVGCGDGLSDPNFTAFRDWMASVFPDRTSPHYRLCCDDEREALEQEHDPRERIDLITYGKHEHLVDVLQSLASGPVRSPKPRKGKGKSPVGSRRVIKSTARPTALGANLKALKTLFFELLAGLKAGRSHFPLTEVQTAVNDAELTLTDDTLKVYLSEATKQGLIHDAGRGWYSRLAEPLKLDPQPVQKLIRATKKALPLLDFCAWSTAQLNPWMTHLLAQPVAFLYVPREALESVGETLRSLGWDVAVNPGKNGAQDVRPGETMVVLRPTHSKQPTDDGHVAAPEQVWIEGLIEAEALSLMDMGEIRAALRAAAEDGRLQMAEMKRFAESKYLDWETIFPINQRHISDK
jgi:hypothetical protein